MPNLERELNIPKDAHTLILPSLCRNFIKKYETRPELHIAQLSGDLKLIVSQIEVYSQCKGDHEVDTYETIAKYQSLHKL